MRHAPGEMVACAHCGTKYPWQIGPFRPLHGEPAQPCARCARDYFKPRLLSDADRARLLAKDWLTVIETVSLYPVGYATVCRWKRLNYVRSKSQRPLLVNRADVERWVFRPHLRQSGPTKTDRLTDWFHANPQWLTGKCRQEGLKVASAALGTPIGARLWSSVRAVLTPERYQHRATLVRWLESCPDQLTVHAKDAYGAYCAALGANVSETKFRLYWTAARKRAGIAQRRGRHG